MSDYIRRQDAVDCMNRYGSVWMEYTEGMSNHEVAEQALKASKRAVIDVLENLPSADVVPVVRCEDCKHLANRDKTGGKCWRGNGFARVVENNDFCSYGERKE